MKKSWLIGIVLLVCVPMMADDTIYVVEEDTVQIEEIPRMNLLEELPGVQIVQDSVMAVLLDEAINGKHEIVEIDGYRVQVYSSNQQQTAKTEALELEAKLKEKVNQTIYVQYLPPFWKVRLGDFRTYDEAREYKKLFVQLFPSKMGETYIVRDKIQVIQ